VGGKRSLLGYLNVKPSNVRKILIIKLRALGDIVLSTPVISNIRQAYPDAQVDFLVEPPGDELLEAHPDINRIVIYPWKKWKTQSWFLSNRSGIQFVQDIRREHYDLVFDLFGNPRSAFLTWLSGASHRVGFNFRGRHYAYNHVIEPRGSEVHEVDFNLDALRYIGIPIKQKNLYFPALPRSEAFVRNWIEKEGLKGKKLAGLHVWGSWPAKRWPLQKFAELADCLIECYGFKVVVIWGPGERKYAEAVAGMTDHPLVIAPETSLQDMGALLSKCHLVIANDSGPMHIAAAVGTPTVGIYGPTSWRLQGPYGKKHGSAYCSGLDCLGCNRLDCPDLHCMKNLSVRSVFKTAGEVIQKNSIPVEFRRGGKNKKHTVRCNHCTE